MRLRILPIAFTFTLLFCLGLSEVHATVSSPDSYGYVWKDSNEPDVTFGWIDITSRAGAVQITGLADDNAVGPFNMGFSFHYYWSDYSSLKVGSNGWLSFDNIGNIASCFPNVPTAGGAGDNIIAPFMSDVSFLSNSAQAPNVGEMWYWSNSVDTFIIQYVDVPWWTNGTPNWVGSNTLEVIFSASDSSITFQYLNTDAGNLQTNTCATVMEIGIENITGNIGLNYTSGMTVPTSNFAVKFVYPAVVGIQVRDVTPAWNANAENAGQFIFTNISTSLEANIACVGNTNVTNTITADGSVLAAGSTTPIWTDTASLSMLNVGANQTVSFPSAVTFATEGHYSFRVQTINNGDINPSNDVNQVEIVAVENLTGNYTLSYASNLGPTGSISWAGGGIDDGVAIKVIPPGFPASISSVEAWIIGDGDPNTPIPIGYDIVIYGEDSAGNVDLNNVLQVESILPANITEDAWNTITLDTPIVVASGGIFVAWLQGGTGVAVGIENIAPISRRSYEILGGAWSPFRDNTVSEFLIRVNTSSPVAIDPAQSLKLSLLTYPNPVKDLSTIVYTVVAQGDVQFRMTNVTGQVVWSKLHSNVAAGEFKFNVDVSELPAGIYFLGMEQNGARSVQKIVVE